MKYIKKAVEPEVLSDFKINYRNDCGNEATYNKITTIVKNKLKSELLKEQFYICCYCMNRVTQINSHIEHVKPQSKFPKETLDYGNLLVSCNGIQDRNENCGHKKTNWFNEAEFITPLNPDCERIFTYSLAGEMDSTERNGKITIAKLNLNSFLLVRARKAAIYSSGLFEPDFSIKKQEMIDYFTIPNSDNELPQFCMTVMYCVNNYS